MLTGIIRGQRLMLRTPIVVADSINYPHPGRTVGR